MYKCYFSCFFILSFVLLVFGGFFLQSLSPFLPPCPSLLCRLPPSFLPPPLPPSLPPSILPSLQPSMRRVFLKAGTIWPLLSKSVVFQYVEGKMKGESGHSMLLLDLKGLCQGFKVRLSDSGVRAWISVLLAWSKQPPCLPSLPVTSPAL